MASSHCLSSPQRLRVRGLSPNMPLKLEHCLQSRQAGGKEYTVRPFQVEFMKMAAKEGALAKREHQITVDNKTVTIFLETSKTPGEGGRGASNSPLTEPLKEPRLAQKHPQEDAAHSTRGAHVSNIFLDVIADLNCNLFSKEQRARIATLFPNVKIMQGPEGIVKVCGDFQDIEKIHHFLSEQLLQSKPSPPTTERKSHEEQDCGSHLAASKPHTRSGERHKYYEVHLPFFEYFNYVCPHKKDWIKKTFGVDIRTAPSSPNTVYLDFVASPSGDLEGACEFYASEFQKITESLTQEHISLADNAQANKMKQKLSSQFTKLLIKEDGRHLTLLGTQGDIAEAKQKISDQLNKSSVKILTSSGKTVGIEVDINHYQLLENELLHDCSEIERKYHTTLRMYLLKDQKMCFLFKPKDKDVDLSAHANESFTDALQRASSQLMTEVLSLTPLDKDKKPLLGTEFTDDFKRKHPHVHVVLNQGSITLTGLPVKLAAAKQYVLQRLGVSPMASEKVHEDHKTHMGIRSHPLDATSPPLRDAGSSEASGMDKKEQDLCVICLEPIRDKQVLSKCKHAFCTPCIRQAMASRPVCPVCQTPYGIQKGNQPEGTMTHSVADFSLPGYSCGTIVITYYFKAGIQTVEHPNPGKPYPGTQRVAYLPDNKEGREVLGLLQVAFKQKLIFTVGFSWVSGKSDVITWNDIHHKTSQTGGPENYGYPDPHYLKRVKEELKAKGITSPDGRTA